MSRRMTQLDIEDREPVDRADGHDAMKKWVLGILAAVIASLIIGWVGSAGAQDKRLYAMEQRAAVLELRVSAVEKLGEDTNSRMRNVEIAVNRLVDQAEAAERAAARKARR